MKSLLFKASMFLIFVNIFWVSMYFLRGYNTTSNIGRLDIDYMISQLTSNTITDSMERLTNIISNGFRDLGNILRDGLSTSPFTTGFLGKIPLTSINTILKFIYYVYKPLFFLIRLLSVISGLLRPVLTFIYGVIQFILFPRFF